MQYQDIKNLTEKELHMNLKDERSSLQKMKFIENPHKLRTVRKTIARYLTEINRRRNEKTVA
jgi:ribosomal protein L29